MKLVKVIGSLTSTVKDQSLEGFKLLLVQSLESDLSDTDDFLIAVDTIGLGEGEIALVTTGSTAKYTEMTKSKNVDAAIVAKVDQIDLET
jgi:ethanolamine utilization protein EutN